MENPASPAVRAPLDWSAPLELEDGTPLRLAEPNEVRAAYGACNPDSTGDWWVARCDGQPFFGATFTICVAPDGLDDLGLFHVRNGAICPDDGNGLADDGICGFCGNAPQGIPDGLVAQVHAGERLVPAGGAA